MADPLRQSFAELCRSARLELDVTQAQLARVAGVSRAHVAAIETGRANPTLRLASRIADALGIDLALSARRPTILEPRQRDLVHARCSAYVQRRLVGAGFDCRREVPLIEGRVRGWIDVLAFDPRAHRLFVIEIKTQLVDLGVVERQVAWYEARAGTLAAAHGWGRPEVNVWLLCLASEEVEDTVRLNREAMDQSFPRRATWMRAAVEGHGSRASDPASRDGSGLATVSRRGLALIDPSSRRRQWLMATRVDGRRTPHRYRDYADAASRLRARG